jgi:translation initiation factor 4B
MRTSYPSRDSRPAVAIPSSPPFILYMGNLDFEITDRDIEMLFGDLLIKNVRIIRDLSGKPKGFGYVEFEDQKSLVEALKLSNQVCFKSAVNI